MANGTLYDRYQATIQRVWTFLDSAYRNGTLTVRIPSITPNVDNPTVPGLTTYATTSYPCTFGEKAEFLKEGEGATETGRMTTRANVTFAHLSPLTYPEFEASIRSAGAAVQVNGKTFELLDIEDDVLAKVAVVVLLEQEGA